MRKKTLIALTLVMLVLVVLGFIIPRKTVPSPETRVILEHNFQTYIAPVCFEKSNPTNFIEDSTLKRAQELNYPPHDACTDKALHPETDPFIISLLKDFQLLDKKWDNW